MSGGISNWPPVGGINASVGPNGSPIPLDSTLIATDVGGNLTPVSAANPMPSQNIPNTNGSIYNNSISAVTAVTAPANAVGFILESESTNTTNLRWCVGGTASSTVGMLAEPGRDSGFVPVDKNISVCPVTGTVAFSVQWILSV